jgi:hypothetical protein
MPHWDGHEVSFVTSIGGAFYLFHRTLPKGWMRGFIHRQPIAAMSVVWAITGMTLPLVVPPIRRALNLPTNQYDASHPNATFPKYTY